MLIVKNSHQQYQSFLQDFLHVYYISSGQQITILKRANLIIKLWITDLSGIVPLIKNRYSKSSKGVSPKDPIALFRSLILMTLSGETSITC